MRRAVMLVLVIVTLATGARAQERVEPARGVFLVAEPTVDAGPFYRSVILLLYHGEIGTLGLVVNRPTKVPLSDALPGLEVGATSHTLYFGGPVGLEGLVVLFRSVAPPENVEPVMEDVYYSGNRGVLEALLKEGGGSDELRIFIGHSGWAPGQLDAELGRGTWEVMRADASTLFGTEPGRLWERLSMSGRTYARASRPPGPSWSGARQEPPGSQPSPTRIPLRTAEP